MSLRTQYDAIVVDNAALMYQGFYMFDKKTAPRSGFGVCVLRVTCSPPGNGESYIEIAFNVTHHIDKKFGYGDIEVRPSLFIYV